MSNYESRNGNIKYRSSLPTPLHRAVEQATKPSFKKHGLAEARLITEWHQIAGAVLAEKALPTKLYFPKGERSGGTLHLLVASGWALEVQHLEPVILDKIATYFGYRAVGKLAIKQGPLPKKSTTKAKAKAAPPPLSKEEEQNLSQATDSVKDPELKAALTALGAAIARRDKKPKTP